jgi:hypothetical protein
MAKKVDTEVVFLKLKSFIKENIAAVAAAIDAEKDDGKTLAVPIATAYVDLSLDGTVINWDPFIFIFVDDLPSQVAGPHVEKNVKFEICFFKAKTGKPDEALMGLRYLRLMEELGRLAWDKALKGFRYEIETLTPVDVQLANSTKWHRVYGVALTVSLA